MKEKGTDVLSQVANKTNSEFVQIAIVFAVLAIVIAIPLYRLVIKARKEALQAKKDTLDQYIKREGLLIDVIKENSTAISELTTMIKNTNDKCNACKTEQTSIMQEVLFETRETRSMVDRATAIMIERGHLENVG